MIKYFEHAAVFMFLFTGFLLLLLRSGVLRGLRDMLIRAKVSMEEQDRKTKLALRNNLQDFEKKNSLWMRIEKELEYTGIRRKVPGITAGKSVVFLTVSAVVFFLLGTLVKGLPGGVTAVVISVMAGGFIMQGLKGRNLKAVNDELPKFLDFLGNYSLTSGELISIFSQISRYLKEPLRSVLEECETESKMTGDVKLALISMADKIEHPQFKQFVRNLEITARYSADFSSLVSDSRRSMREYLSQSRDRKGMLREAGINMGLLLIMSVVVLLAVNLLIGGGIGQILLETMPGHLAVGGMTLILVLFGFQVFTMNK